MITIAPAETVEDLHQCEALQKVIWGFEDISVVPHHLMLTAIKSGGLALGAYEGEGRHPGAWSPGQTQIETQPTRPSVRHKIVGFLFGFPGIEGGKLKHCSLMCGVLPDKRFQGLGYDLKLAQREFVMRQSIDLITWTFDPLQSANAYFNFHKLGVLAHRYERNLYGSLRDRLNQGLDTDRFAVEWWVKSPRVRARLEGNQRPTSEAILAGAQTVNHTVREHGLLRNREYSLSHKESRLLVEVPYRLAELKEKDLESAKQWRQETREIFEAYLRRGYSVADFTVIELAGEKRSFYLLEDTLRDEILERT